MSTLKLVLIFFCLCLLFLGLPGIWGSSEAREGQVVWVLMHGGDWVLPLRNGIVPSKPPLFHWTAAAIGGLGFPHSEFLVRLPSLIAAAGILLLVGCFVNRVRPALTSTVLVVLSLSYGFVRLALDARVDMFFAFFVVACSLAVIEPLVQGARPGLRQLVLFYLLSGAAVLAKGPLGLALPGFTCFVCFAATQGFWSAIKFFLNPLGIIIFLVVALPWYLAAANVGSDAFISRQLLFENVQRFLGGEDVNRQAVWYYMPEIVLGTLPWCLAIFLAWRHPKLSEVEHRLVKICGIWVFSGVLLFSAASGKRASYLLPLYPALSIILAIYIQRAYQALSANSFLVLRKGITGAVFAIGVLFVGLAALVETLAPVLVARGLMVPIFSPLVAPSLLVVGVVILLMGWLSVSRGRGQGGAAYAIFLFSYLLVLQGGLWVKHKLKGFDVAAESINSYVGGDRLTVIKGQREEFFDPLFFYLRREVKIAPEEQGSLGCQGWAVLKVDANFEQWGAEQSVVARYAQLDIDGKKRREFALVRCR